MTATPGAFRPRYYSEIVKEAPGSYDDCALCAGLVLFEMVTLREGVTKNDGSLFDTIRLRELRDEAGLKPDGPLRFNDIAQYLAFLSDKVGIVPAFALDYYPGHPGGTLRLTWEQFRDKVTRGHVAVLLGNPIGVKDPDSPLRTKQNNDDYGHAIAVFDGGPNGATVYDALTRRGENWKGERVRWDDLRQFTEAKKDGDRLYGTPTSVACAVAVVGGYTAAARTAAVKDRELAKVRERLVLATGQVSLVTDERDQAKRDLKVATDKVVEQDAALIAANARIAELEALTPPDCTEQLRVQREGLLALVSEGVDELVARLRDAA